MYGKYTVLQHRVMTDLVNKFNTLPELMGPTIFNTAEPELSNNIQIDIVHSARHLAHFRDPDEEAHIKSNQRVDAIMAQIHHTI